MFLFVYNTYYYLVFKRHRNLLRNIDLISIEISNIKSKLKRIVIFFKISPS
ncbi:hypothetical protein BBUWI9123_J0014 (plasmid) [Borreliella burgdorferi WI91-23]|nr:hypothetical protein BBU64B_J0014 [Borreliella burgdorferi 64b]ACN55681.1 hypothetical protein BBUWI9123_J0014 [Borreliella burgdorferi WI91-23]